MPGAANAMMRSAAQNAGAAQASLLLDGVNDYGEVHWPSMAPSTNETRGIVFRITGNLTTTRALFFSPTTASTSPGWIAVNQTGAMFSYAWNGSTARSRNYPAGSVVVGEWYHATLTQQSLNNTMDPMLYLNGIPSPLNSNSGNTQQYASTWIFRSNTYTTGNIRCFYRVRAFLTDLQALQLHELVWDQDDEGAKNFLLALDPLAEYYAVTDEVLPSSIPDLCGNGPDTPFYNWPVLSPDVPPKIPVVVPTQRAVMFYGYAALNYMDPGWTPFAPSSNGTTGVYMKWSGGGAAPTMGGDTVGAPGCTNTSTSGIAQFTASNGSSPRYAYSSVYVPSSWGSHIGVQRIAADPIVYVNGVNVTTGATGSFTSTATKRFIGLSALTSTYYYRGLLHCWFTCSAALSDVEVATLHALMDAGDDDGAAAYLLSFDPAAEYHVVLENSSLEPGVYGVVDLTGNSTGTMAVNMTTSKNLWLGKVP